MTDKVLAWFRRRADNVAVALLSATFAAFILQIVSRYVIRQPLGWTLEACLLCWLWLVFWSGAFILRDEDHVRFSVVSDAVRPGVRRMFGIVAAIAIIAAFAAALPPTLDFVQFMAIEKTSLLKIRFDYVFAVYLIFAVGIIVRYSCRLVAFMRRQDGSIAP